MTNMQNDAQQHFEETKEILLQMKDNFMSAGWRPVSSKIEINNESFSFRFFNNETEQILKIMII